MKIYVYDLTLRMQIQQQQQHPSTHLVFTTTNNNYYYYALFFIPDINTYKYTNNTIKNVQNKPRKICNITIGVYALLSQKKTK